MTRAEHSVKSVITVFLIILSTVMIDTAWKISLENSARTQAKYNLAQIKSCVNDILLVDEEGLYTNFKTKSKSELERTLDICAKNMKVSPNGDVWAYDLRTKAYVFESNPRYHGTKGRFWDRKKVCKEKDEWCGKLVAIMGSGYDSTWLGYSWLFKHDKEYLEWKVLPSEDIGFDEHSRGKIAEPQQIVVVQGAREQELLERYKWFRATVYGLGFFMIILNLLLQSNYTKHRRRKSDA